MLQWQPQTVLLCEPKTVLVNARFDTGMGTYHGSCEIQPRLDYVSAMRVKYINITLQSGDIVAYDATLVQLSSNRIGSMLGPNLYLVGSSHNAGSNIQVATVSNIIGQSQIVNQASLQNIDQNHSNNIHRLPSAQSIDNFDWSISVVGEGLPTSMSHPYVIEFVIEFFQACPCQKSYENVYST